MSWNAERIEALRKLWKDGLSAAQIANELGNGVSRNAVIGKITRLGLSGSDKRKPKSKPAPSPSKAMEARARQSDSAHAPKPPLPRQLPRKAAGPPIAIAPPAREIAAPDSARRVTIIDLREGMCRWPMGDPATPEFRYCGGDAPSESGPYCPFHRRIAYQPPRERPPTKKH